MTLLGVLGALACGEPPTPDGVDRADEDVIEGEERGPELVAPLCDPCPPPPAPPPARQRHALPHVAIFPQFLGFYGDVQAGEEVAAKTVSVQNKTPQPILIYAVRILDDVDSLTGGEGAAYFAVEAPGEQTVLTPGATIDFPVTFSRCSEQRSARLVVSTSHPGFGSLTVHLTGKYFH